MNKDPETEALFDKWRKEADDSDDNWADRFSLLHEYAKPFFGEAPEAGGEGDKPAA